MTDNLRPAAIAAQLGIEPQKLRQWMQQLDPEEHPFVAGHRYAERWEFSPAQASEIVNLYRREHRELSPLEQKALAQRVLPDGFRAGEVTREGKRSMVAIVKDDDPEWVEWDFPALYVHNVSGQVQWIDPVSGQERSAPEFDES